MLEISKYSTGESIFQFGEVRCIVEVPLSLPVRNANPGPAPVTGRSMEFALVQRSLQSLPPTNKRLLQDWRFARLSQQDFPDQQATDTIPGDLSELCHIASNKI